MYPLPLRTALFSLHSFCKHYASPTSSFLLLYSSFPFPLLPELPLPFLTQSAVSVGIALQPLDPIRYTSLLLYTVSAPTHAWALQSITQLTILHYPFSLSYQLNTRPVQQTPGAQPRVSPKCQFLELSSTASPAVLTLSLSLHCT